MEKKIKKRKGNSNKVNKKGKIQMKWSKVKIYFSLSFDV